MAIVNPFQNNRLQTEGLGRSLIGLGQTIGMQRQQEEQKEQQAQKKQELLNVLESNDIIAQRDFIAANPQYAQQFEQALGFQDQATKQNLVDSSMRILQGEDPHEVIRDRAAFVSRAGGNPADTLDSLQDSPEDIRQAAQFAVAAYGTPQQVEALGIEKPMTAFQKAQLEQGQQRIDITKDKQRSGGAGTSTQKDFKTYKDLKRTDPEAAKEFGQAAGFITPEGKELSVHLQKRLSEATDSAIESRSNAVEFESLAAQFDKADVGGGLFQGSWGEKFKDFTGNQDAKTALRKRYNTIRGSQVVKNLPPGSASDVDIALALSGFPTDNATGKEISSFLRGTAKLEAKKAEFDDFKANFISDNNSEKGMLKAWKEQQTATAPAGDMTDEDLSKSLGL